MKRELVFFKDELMMGRDFGWRDFEKWGLGVLRRGVKDEGEEMMDSIAGGENGGKLR